MSSLKSAVASVLRLVGVGLLLLGVVFLVLAYAGSRQDEGSLWQWAAGGLGFVGGIALLACSSPLARRFTRDYE